MDIRQFWRVVLEQDRKYRDRTQEQAQKEQGITDAS